MYRLISIAYLSILVCLVSPAQTVIAADITVDAECSLADAILAAESDRAVGGCPVGDGADTIHLSGDITLSEELPQISSDITIEGGGYAISGDNAYRIFYIADGALTLNQLTLTKGSADYGGAIINHEGTLDITNSTFAKNKAVWIGGAIESRGVLNISGSSFTDNSNEGNSGGAIANYGPAIITGSSFSGNTASARGGAISNIYDTMTIVGSKFTNNATEDYSGGAIFNGSGQLSISESRFENNSAAKSGGAIRNDSAYGGPYGELIVTGSTFAGNRAEIGGGGAISSTDYNKLSIANSSFTNNFANIFGGAITSFGELSVVNSTLTGNSSDGGGGLFLFSLGTNTLAHLTLTNNTADEGGGIYVRQVDKAVNLYNSLIAGNEGGDCIGKQLSANVGNIIADGSCDPAISGDPKLGALVKSEDGSPAYLPLLASSPAIDAAHPDHCTATDQTGTPRPRGEACDIGAYEFKRE